MAMQEPTGENSSFKPKTGADRAGGVQSLTRALSILDALADYEDGLSLTALAKLVELPPSSVHRLLTTLQRKRFVRFEPGVMIWRVGVQAFVVGNSFARSREVAPIAMPHMRQLMEKTGETVNLYIPNDGQAICINQVQCRQVIRAISRPGGSVPLSRSASGKAMLSKLSEHEVDDILARQQRSDSNGIFGAERSKLHADLAVIRAQGFALDDEDVAVGLRCIATPILDEHGVAQAAMSIAGPISRIADSRLPRLAEMVVAAGMAVTREYGGYVPSVKSSQG